MSYRVKGLSLTYKGTPFNFFGVNLTGLELKAGHLVGMWTKKTHEDFVKVVKAQGFNGVRIPITSSTLRGTVVPNSSSVGWYPPNDYMKGWDSRKMFLDLLDKLDQQEIRYILDWHYLEDGAGPDGGSIPPKWYTDRYTDQDWIRDLTDLATLLKGRRGAVGIDLKNEPDGVRPGVNGCTWGDGNIKTDWKLASERAFQAIDSVNQDLVVFIEWLGQGSGLDYMLQNPPQIPEDRYALSVHIYGPGTWEFEPYSAMYASANYPFNLNAHFDKQWGNVAKKKLVFLGEYGSYYDSGRQKAWLDTIVKYAVDNGINNCSAYWSLTAESDGSGGIYADGSYDKIRTDKVSAITPMKTLKLVTSVPEVTPEPEVFPETPEIPGGVAAPDTNSDDDISLDETEDQWIGQYKTMVFGPVRKVVAVVGKQGNFYRVKYLDTYEEMRETLVHKGLLS